MNLYLRSTWWQKLCFLFMFWSHSDREWRIFPISLNDTFKLARLCIRILFLSWILNARLFRKKYLTFNLRNMSLFAYIEPIQYIDYLIRTKSMWSPEELAKKMNTITSVWYLLRNKLMEDYGFSIRNSKWIRRYVYAEEGLCFIRIELKN